MKKLALLIVLISIIFPCGEINAQNIISQNLTAEEWGEDLKEFVQALENIHPDPYFRYNKNAFYSDLNSLRSKLPILTNDEVYLELSKLIASLQDGHSHIPFHQDAFTISALPVKMFKFDDGLFITDAMDTELEGSKVLRIGNKTAEQIYYDFFATLPADNIYHLKNIYTIWASFPEVLTAMGIIETPDSIRIEILNAEGDIESVLLSAVTLNKWMHWRHGLDNESGLPLYRSNWDDYYWHKKIPDSDILYMKYNQVLSREDTNMTAYAAKLDSLINSDDKIQRMAIDLRENPGGNKYRMRPLVRMLKANEKVNQPGKLFLITGRRTNSAATSFITEMKLNTHALLAGEPIGGSPNFYSDVRSIILPNSKIKVSISTQLQQDSFYEDNRRSHFPDFEIPRTSEAFFDKRDSALEFITAFSEYNDWNNEPKNDHFETLGKYRLGPARALMAGRDIDYLKIFSDGLVEKKLKYNTETDSYFSSDKGLEVTIKEDQTALHLRGHGVEKTVRRLPAGHLTAVEKLNVGRISEGIEEIRELSKKYESEAIVAESLLNSLGYQYLRKEDYDSAINIFTLNTSLYPKSANVYDSLGEAYLEAGDKSKAVENYRKSLDINPGNEKAKEVIDKHSQGN